MPGGFADRSALPKGGNGRTLCRWCSLEVPPRRFTFCSDWCVHECRLRSDPGYLREQVLIGTAVGEAIFPQFLYDFFTNWGLYLVHDEKVEEGGNYDDDVVRNPHDCGAFGGLPSLVQGIYSAVTPSTVS
jgi:hypothetical protein